MEKAKRILILSDNQKLSKALALSLENSWPVTQLVLDTPNLSLNSRAENNFILIIVALDSPAGEPILALAKASLAQYIGRVPLLIISDRPFPADQEAHISHLDFPFSSESFYRKVCEILEHRPPGAPGTGGS